MMKYIAFLLSISLLMISCGGETTENTADDTPVDASKLIPEHRYALEICQCLGKENRNEIDKLNQIIAEKGRNVMNEDSVMREKYAPVGAIMTSCMGEIEKQFATDGVDPMSETFEENFYNGLKEQCPEMYTFMVSIKPEGE